MLKKIIALKKNITNTVTERKFPSLCTTTITCTGLSVTSPEGVTFFTAGLQTVSSV